MYETFFHALHGTKNRAGRNKLIACVSPAFGVCGAHADNFSYTCSEAECVVDTSIGPKRVKHA